MFALKFFGAPFLGLETVVVGTDERSIAFEAPPGLTNRVASASPGRFAGGEVFVLYRDDRAVVGYHALVRKEGKAFPIGHGMAIVHTPLLRVVSSALTDEGTLYEVGGIPDAKNSLSVPGDQEDFSSEFGVNVRALYGPANGRYHLVGM